jgi:hypothetical protein
MGNLLIVIGVILVVIACVGFLIGCFGGADEGACLLVVIVLVCAVAGAWLISTGNGMKDAARHKEGALPPSSHTTHH